MVASHELTLTRHGEKKVLKVQYDTAVAMFKCQAESDGWTVTVRKLGKEE